MSKKVANRCVSAVSALLLILLQVSVSASVCLPHVNPGTAAELESVDTAHIHAAHNMSGMAQHVVVSAAVSGTAATVDAGSGDCCGTQCHCPSACAGVAAAVAATAVSMPRLSERNILPSDQTAVSAIAEGHFRPPISA